MIATSVTRIATRLGALCAGLMASTTALAAEITVFNRGLQSILDTAWGRFGVLVATLAIVFFGFQLLLGRFSLARAALIIVGILVIWGAVEIFNAFA